MFNEQYRLGYFSGLPLEATIETGENSQISKRIFVRGFMPVTDAAIVYGSTGKRDTLHVAPTYTTESKTNIIGSCPQRAETRFARARIRIPAGTTWTFATGVEPDFAPAGSR